MGAINVCHAKRGSDESSRASLSADDELEEEGEPVYLNIYDLSIANYTLNRIGGMGVYHTGVVVYGREYSYAGHFHREDTGLKNSKPRDTSWLHDAVFRECILVGYTQLTRERVSEIFEQLKPQFPGPAYNVVEMNCNHFSQKFLKILTKKELPAYVNRIMRVAEKVRPCLPAMFKTDLRDQDAPPEYDSHKYKIPQPKDHVQTPARASDVKQGMGSSGKERNKENKENKEKEET